MTYYTFFVKESGYADDDPHYDRTVRKCDCDAQAEMIARRVSASGGGVGVWISRGQPTVPGRGSSWLVSCGFKAEI